MAVLKRAGNRPKTVRRPGTILKWVGIALFGVLALLAGVFAVLPKVSRDLMPYQDLTRLPKPLADKVAFLKEMDEKLYRRVSSSGSAA